MIAQDTLKFRGEIDFVHYARFNEWYFRAMQKVLKHLQFARFNFYVPFMQRFGTVKEKWTQKNTVTTAGKGIFSGLIGGVGGYSVFQYLEVGLSTTAPAAGQTALISAITDSGLARHIATMSQQMTITANDTLQFLYAWTASGTKTVEEIGFFNASSAGTMGGRALSGSKPIISGDVLTATYKLILS